MKKLLLLSIIAISFLSCNFKQRKMEYLICKDSIQYWDYIPDGRGASIKSGFGFNKKGIAKDFHIYEKGNRWVAKDCENSTKYECEKWSVTEDSIFTKKPSRNIIYYLKMKILKCTDDTILGESLNSKGKILLIRVLDLKSIIKPGDPRDTLNNKYFHVIDL